MKIYKITNLLNGKLYIGQQCRASKTYFCGGKYIKSAIRKYGRVNFSKDTVCEGAYTKNLLNELERFYIQAYNSRNLEIGYNLAKGGESCYGIKRSEETKQKIREANLGRKDSPERIKKSVSKRIGRKQTQEAIKKRIESRRGYTHSKETREKISKANMNKVRSLEVRRKISNSNIGKIPWNKGKNTGLIPWNKGKRTGQIPWNKGLRGTPAHVVSAGLSSRRLREKALFLTEQV
ncbi:MAG: hypothetical protein KGJ90_07340 [Patescibacteria group bacterium]|nr:hypothetical protein [Patescibacteria group bacterium]